MLLMFFNFFIFLKDFILNQIFFFLDYFLRFLGKLGNFENLEKSNWGLKVFLKEGVQEFEKILQN